MVMIPYFSTLTSLGFFDIKKDARGERDGGGAGWQKGSSYETLHELTRTSQGFFSIK